MRAPILPLQHPEALARATQTLRNGELVVVPTDTVYGVAAIPTALGVLLARIYGSREAEPWPAPPLLLSSASILPRLARVSRVAERLARHFWPGALTLILPPGPDSPFPLKTARIAARKPNFPALYPLLEAMGGFLIVGRAAPSGYPSSITAQEAFDFLGDEVALILDGGRSPVGITSTVVDCIKDPPCLAQRGAIPEDKILALLAAEFQSSCA